MFIKFGRSVGHKINIYQNTDSPDPETLIFYYNVYSTMAGENTVLEEL